MSAKINKTFGLQLKKMRVQKGFSIEIKANYQKEVADKSGETLQDFKTISFYRSINLYPIRRLSGIHFSIVGRTSDDFKLKTTPEICHWKFWVQGYILQTIGTNRQKYPLPIRFRTFHSLICIHFENSLHSFKQLHERNMDSLFQKIALFM